MRIRIALIGAVFLSLVTTSASAAPPAPPTVETPASVRVRAHSYAGAEATFATAAIDWWGRSLPVSCSPASGSDFQLGRTVVACSATDRRHVTTTERFPVTTTMLWAPRNGARVTKPPVLRWAPIARTKHYNVQLYRGATKVLSAWPRRARLALAESWAFGGRTYTLRAHAYRWYVWPYVGTRYRRVLGTSTFSVRR